MNMPFSQDGPNFQPWNGPMGGQAALAYGAKNAPQPAAAQVTPAPSGSATVSGIQQAASKAASIRERYSNSPLVRDARRELAPNLEKKAIATWLLRLLPRLLQGGARGVQYAGRGLQRVGRGLEKKPGMGTSRFGDKSPAALDSMLFSLGEGVERVGDAGHGVGGALGRQADKFDWLGPLLRDPSLRRPGNYAPRRAVAGLLADTAAGSAGYLGGSIAALKAYGKHLPGLSDPDKSGSDNIHNLAASFAKGAESSSDAPWTPPAVGSLWKPGGSGKPIPVTQEDIIGWQENKYNRPRPSQLVPGGVPPAPPASGGGGWLEGLKSFFSTMGSQGSPGSHHFYGHPGGARP